MRNKSLFAGLSFLALLYCNNEVNSEPIIVSAPPPLTAPLRLEKRLSESMKREKIKYFLPLSAKYDYLDEIFEESYCNNLDPIEIAAIIKQESNGDPYAVIDGKTKKESRGLMQLNIRYHKLTDYYNPFSNIMIGTFYYKFLRDKYDGNVVKALAAYNAGPNMVDMWIRKGWKGEIDKIPFRITRAYVKNIISMIDELKRT